MKYELKYFSDDYGFCALAEFRFSSDARRFMEEYFRFHRCYLELFKYDGSGGDGVTVKVLEGDDELSNKRLCK